MDPALSIDEHIDLASNTKLGKIDSRFDGKAATRQHAARFVRFEIIHVGTVTVNFLADTVTRPMDEELAITRFLDNFSAGIIDFKSS